MTNTQVKLFYSYCHRDGEHLERLEKVLAPVRDEGILADWSDRKIGIGELLEPKIEAHLRGADIVVLLVSADFLASKACMQEMKVSLRLARKNEIAVLPVILSPCGWQDTPLRPHKAWPTDGKPVLSWEQPDQAWENVRVAVTDKIKEIHQNKAPTLKGDFSNFLQKVEFVSDGRRAISLGQLYVPPHLTSMSQGVLLDDTPKNCYPDIMRFSGCQKTLIRGVNLSGKTAMCKHVYAQAREKGMFPLYIDGGVTYKVKAKNIMKQSFQKQYNGRYETYRDLPADSKIIIIDNADSLSNKLRDDIVNFAEKSVQQIFFFVQDDNYTLSMYKDKGLAAFDCFQISDYDRKQRRQCINKWMELKDKKVDLYDEESELRHLEDIFRHRVMPPYPYYIYSILQAKEAFMPSDLQMTQSAHCHHAIIVAHLIKSGVKSEDIDSYYGYLSELAYFMHTRNAECLSDSEMRGFTEQYKRDYSFHYDEDKILRALSGGAYPTLRKRQDGDAEEYCFQSDYAYYFFLGAYIARDIKKNEQLVKELRNTLYRRHSALVLLFTIHHTKDAGIIEDIVIQGLLHYDKKPEARLDEKETKFMSSLLADIPKKIMDGTKNAREERERGDALQDKHARESEKTEASAEKLAETDEGLKDFLTAVKTMEVLGQILRNHGGSLRKNILSEIFGSAQSLGLRMLKYLLDDLQEDDFSQYLLAHAREREGKDASEAQIQARVNKFVAAFTFSLVSGVLYKTAYEISSEKCLEIADNDSGETPARLLVNYIIHLIADKGYRLDQKDNRKLMNKFEQLAKKFESNPYAKTLLRGLTAGYAHRHEALPQHKQRLKNLINKNP